MDNFVIAVLIGAGIVIGILALAIVFDSKAKPSAPASTAPAKAAGKR